jgi:hypothetical protein
MAIRANLSFLPVLLSTFSWHVGVAWMPRVGRGAMANSIYVVHGFRHGCEGVTQYFKTEVLAREYAAYLGGLFDGVVMWQQSPEHETGDDVKAPTGV